MAGGEPLSTNTLEYVHQQSRRAEAFAKRGDFKRAISSHQAAAATLRQLIRSVTEGQLASYRHSTGGAAEEFVQLESLYAQLEQHTVRQSVLLEQQLQLLGSRSNARSTSSQASTAQQQQQQQPFRAQRGVVQPTGVAVADSCLRQGGAKSGLLGSKASPTFSRARMEEGSGGCNTEDEEKDVLINDLRIQIDALAKRNEALAKENEQLRANLTLSRTEQEPPDTAVAESACRAPLDVDKTGFDTPIEIGGIALHDLPPLQLPTFDPRGFESD